MESLHGSVTRSDAVSLSGSDAALRREVRAGRMRREHRGVYVDVRHDFDEQTRLAAALLRAGPGAHLSHDTAAILHGLMTAVGETPIHVTVPARRRPRSGDGLIVHRATTLHPADRKIVDGLAVTGVERTVLDRCGLISSERDRVAMVAEAMQTGRTTADRLAATVERSRPVRGCDRLTWALHVLDPGFETIIELELAQLCADAGLAVTPQVVVAVAGEFEYRLDLLDEELLLDLEADGALTHLHLAGHERDVIRDEQLRGVGLEVGRFTGHQIVRRRYETRARLKALRSRRQQQLIRLAPRALIKSSTLVDRRG